MCLRLLRSWVLFGEETCSQKAALGRLVYAVGPGSFCVEVSERHRHRYEVNNAYREQIAYGSGLVFPGTSPDGQLVEFVEYPKDVHPYLVATQAHPEYKSRPTRPHPLFDGLVGAALGK